jgi:P27 family predicted phage terminase small subunit
MTRGRYKTPASVKALAGDPGGAKLVNRDGGGAPVAPYWLTKRAKIIWDQTVLDAAASGILWRVDQAVLSLYCTLMDQLEEVQVELALNGIMIETKWGKKSSPALRAQHEIIKQLRSVCDQMGFSPASRTRIKAGSPPSAEADEFEAFLGRGLDGPKDNEETI